MYLTNQIKVGTRCCECNYPLQNYSEIDGVLCALKRYRKARVLVNPDKVFSTKLICVNCMQKGNFRIRESTINDFVKQVKGEMIVA